MATTVSEAAKAVNAFMGFSSGNQDALLEVLQDYFSSSDGPERDDWDDDDTELEDSAGGVDLLQGTILVQLPLIVCIRY